MQTLIALLRAVNVGGTGKLPMSELKRLCEEAGFSNVQTYIASGNVLFDSALTPAKAKAALEAALHAYAGKPVGVLVRTVAEMAAVLAANPFPDAAPQHTMAIFLDQTPPADVLSTVRGQADEQLALGTREVYVSYGSGMGRSKLKIPLAEQGTARNMNSVAKLVELGQARSKD